MTNTLIHGIIDALSGSVSKEVIVFLISMIPILELRGALLVAGPILGVKVSTAIPLSGFQIELHLCHASGL